MNDEEIRSTIEQMKAQLKAKPENAEKSEDEIDEIMLNGFLKAVSEGEMSKEDLITLAEAMGYEPTEEFKNDSEDPSTFAGEEGGAPTKEELEEVREIKPGESKEEFKEKVEDVKEGKDIEGEEEGEEEEEEKEENLSEEEQRKKASELFKMNF